MIINGREMAYFGSWFPRVHSRVTGPHVLGQNMVLVGVCDQPESGEEQVGQDNALQRHPRAALNSLSSPRWL